MLFAERFHDPIRRGTITLTVRRWKRPQARTGGVYRLFTGGFIEATAVDVIEPRVLDDIDAIAAGFNSARELLTELEPFEGDLYRIAFRYRGDMQDERALLAADDALSEDDRAAIAERLARMDGGGRGAWTMDLLRLIAENEGTRAADLAERVGREVVRFKADVRRLKSLGLTESLEVGYRLSSRGRALLRPAEAPDASAS
ncbi:MAG: hypothetical protein O2822_09200 [Chloroflexi bacterium]|nr:hypothetical protein [Chloroflexota bacterium]